MNRKPTAAIRSHVSAATPTVATDEPVTAGQAIETTAPTFTSPTPNQGMNTMINNNVDFAAIGKANLEAFTASGKIWAAGVQDLTKQFAATAKTSVEESVAAFKALTTVKSVKEAIDLQTAYGKTVAAKAQAESTKLTQASIKLTERAMAPSSTPMIAGVP